MTASTVHTLYMFWLIVTSCCSVNCSVLQNNPGCLDWVGIWSWQGITRPWHHSAYSGLLFSEIPVAPLSQHHHTAATLHPLSRGNEDISPMREWSSACKPYLLSNCSVQHSPDTRGTLLNRFNERMTALYVVGSDSALSSSLRTKFNSLKAYLHQFQCSSGKDLAAQSLSALGDLSWMLNWSQSGNALCNAWHWACIHMPVSGLLFSSFWYLNFN